MRSPWPWTTRNEFPSCLIATLLLIIVFDEGSVLNQVDSFPHIDFKNDLRGRLRMLDMRWKVLDRAMNVSEVAAPGDAAFRATLLRQLATDFLGRLVEVRIARS